VTGHVRRRGAKTWELKFDLDADPHTGKRITRYHSFKGTKREAEAELVV
jgi:integrase